MKFLVYLVLSQITLLWILFISLTANLYPYYGDSYFLSKQVSLQSLEASTLLSAIGIVLSILFGAFAILHCKRQHKNTRRFLASSLFLLLAELSFFVHQYITLVTLRSGLFHCDVFSGREPGCYVREDHSRLQQVDNLSE